MQFPKIEGYRLPAMKTKLIVSKTPSRSTGSSVLDSSHNKEKKSRLLFFTMMHLQRKCETMTTEEIAEPSLQKKFVYKFTMKRIK